MEIHELNTFSGTPGSGDYFATDNGNDTSKISAEDLFAPLNARIDNILTDPAPSAQEVTDARLGAADLGSTHYASLGAAVRGQVSELFNRMTRVSNVMVNGSNASSYPDVNTFPNRTIILVLPSANIQNKPFPSCTIITTGFSLTPTAPYGGSLQIAIQFGGGAVAIRGNDGSNWSEWEIYDKKYVAAMASDVTVSSGNASSYPDVNTFPNRKVITVLESANILNKPFSSFTIITTGFATTNAAPYGGSVQLAFSLNGGTAARTYDGANWAPWHYTSGTLKANPSNFIEKIIEATRIPNSTLILESGTYNVFDSAHNEAYWKNNRPATRYCGINLSNGVKLIGEGSVKINAVYTGTDEDIKENFSVFNIAGSCEIHNIDVEAQNICYIVHDDSPIVGNNSNSAVIEGCKFIHNGSDHTFSSGAPMCIGAGETVNTFRKYLNNIFSSNYERSVNVHTKSGGSGKYIIQGNYFIAGTLGFTAFGDGTGTLTSIVSNNSLPSDVIDRTNGAATLYKFNNEIR